MKIIKYDYKTVSEILEISVKSSYNKIYGTTDFTLRELITLKKHYDISFDDLFKIIDEYRKK